MENFVKKHLNLFIIITSLIIPVAIIGIASIIILTIYKTESIGLSAIFIYGFVGFVSIVIGIIALITYIILLRLIIKYTEVILLPIILPLIVCLFLAILGIIMIQVRNTNIQKNYTIDVFTNEILDEVNECGAYDTEYIQDERIIVFDLEFYFDYEFNAYRKLREHYITDTETQKMYIRKAMPTIIERLKEEPILYENDIVNIKRYELITNTDSTFDIKIVFTNNKYKTYHID